MTRNIYEKEPKMTRNISKFILAVMLASLMVCITIQVQAKMTVEQAAKLKNELTPTGGKRAENKEGSIPAWTEGLSKIPENVVFDPSKGHHPDPFTEDKILFTITSENVDQYKDKLTPGQLDLFKRYPDSWKMHIYPTRRTVAFSDKVYKGTYDNALSAELVGDDGSMENYYVGYPFPIPSNGAEAILNFLNRPMGSKNFAYATLAVVVEPNGQQTRSRVENIFMSLAEGVSREKFDPEDFTTGFLYAFKTPPGRKGELFLRLFRGDYRKSDAGGWAYMPGQRRVRRAPNVFYDGVDASSGGLMTNDGSYMYSSKIDRFDWKLIKEKKEIFVPYNCYRLDLESNVDLLLTPRHPNPEFVRWELHRVWEVVATLKEGFRHAYGKRVYYLDEDSWHILLKDAYDTRGSLWRYSFSCGKQFYELPAYRMVSFHNFDKQVDTYYSAGLVNGQPPFDNEDIPTSYFSVQHLRKLGKR